MFKDARVDQRLLDEIFTPFGWKRTHQMIDGIHTLEEMNGEIYKKALQGLKKTRTKEAA